MFSAICPRCDATATLTPPDSSALLKYSCPGCRRQLFITRAEAQSGGRASVNAPYIPPQRLSDVGVRTAGGLACPNCGGTSFKLKRSIGQKVGFAGGAAATVLTAGAVLPTFGAAGVAAVARASRVVCIPCGKTFVRG